MKRASRPGEGPLPGRRVREVARYGKRARGGDRMWREFCNAPETWHEPNETQSAEYRIIEQPAGKGYRHVLTADDVRMRLAQLPPHMLAGLEVVQFSQMTRKKLGFPCYGMQWGTAIYLYPIEESRIERFGRDPGPSQLIEARMYGGQWVKRAPSDWELRWTDAAIRDFYLNNILIHELGHIIDRRNTSYLDRERFAEWFAIEYGYKSHEREQLAAASVAQLRRVTRRHHKSVR